jgi:hypothetical protein
MKLVRNAGTDRVFDLIRPALAAGDRLDLVTSTASLFAFAELLGELSPLQKVRLVLPPEGSDLAFLGTDGDRAARNRLQARWLANLLAAWVAVQNTE